MTSTDSPKKWVEPHERKNGPWEDYELDDMGRHMEMAEKIKGNPKLVEAVAAHHAKKAKHHQKIAGQMRHHMKSGLVSEKSLERAAKMKHA